MNWQGKTVGYAITGSHCTFEEVMPVISRFVAEEPTSFQLFRTRY